MLSIADTEFPFERLAAQFVRALRGRRSSMRLSRRLGHKTNVVYRWETGLRFPTATQTLRLAQCTGRRPYDVMVDFDHDLAEHEALSAPEPQAVAHLMRAMSKGHGVVALSRRAGLSRFAVSRFLKGRTEPRLPDFLRFVQASTGRLLDWISGFVAPDALSSVREQWLELEAMRELAYRYPYSEALLATIETTAYQSRRRSVGWLADKTGIALAEAKQTLAAMSDAGVIRWRGGRWSVTPGRRVDTRRVPEEFERLKRFWAAEASDRLHASNHGLAAYSVMSIAQRDLDRVAALLLEYYREVRRICAASEPSERVVLLNIHVCPLDGADALHRRDQV